MSRDVPASRRCSMPRCERAGDHSAGPGVLCDYHFNQVDEVGAAEDDAQVSDEPVAGEKSAPDTAEFAHDAPSSTQESDELKIDLHDVDPETYPENLVENGARWLLWQDSDDRKVPRNPTWGRSDRNDGYAFVGAKNPEAWCDFESARDWVEHDDALGLAYYLTAPDCDDWDDDAKYAWVDPDEDVPEEPHVGLLDFDDIRDPEYRRRGASRRHAPGAAGWDVL